MDYTILTRSPLFRGLKADEIEKTISSIPYRVRRFPSGTMVAQSGDAVNTFMIVLSGYVKGEMIDFTGRVIKIEDIAVAGAIAPAFMFGNRNRFPVNVIAVPDTELMIIDKAEFLKLLKGNDLILTNFLDMISNRSQFLSEKIKFLNFKTIKSKLAQYILDLAQGGKSDIRLDRSQTDLADYFGVARPSVARALGELEEMGLIETKGKDIKVLRRKDLAELIND
jgi:CRP-like cAMP-binding protein